MRFIGAAGMILFLCLAVACETYLEQPGDDFMGSVLEDPELLQDGSATSTKLASNLFALNGAVHTGVLIQDGKALLIDCCDSVTPEILARLGVERVDFILATQYRRPNTAGAGAFLKLGARLIAPEAERALFEAPQSYWNDPKNRWHLYHQRPGPEVPARAMPVSRGVKQGDTILWEGYTISVLDTPGMTDGSVSYLLEVEGKKICFSGDVLYGEGQLWDVYSLQKGFGGVRDYYGFLGARKDLVASLRKLGSCGAEVLIPSHGELIASPQRAVEMTIERLDALWRNYASISALNDYFPKLLKDMKDDPMRMKVAETKEMPLFVRRVAATSFAVISETGEALVVDCGKPAVVRKLRAWIKELDIVAVEGCWVTHYHDDNTDALAKLEAAFGCPIMTDQNLTEILEHPERFILPCMSPNAVTVTRSTQDGETWQWREFTLTAFHFPGQTFYHGGLLVEGHGQRVFFAGDSGAPTGLDDYCTGNRCFLGRDKGFRRCIEIWRETQPDFIINQHQNQAFSFTDEQLNYMDGVLSEREQILEEMTPWDSANFAIDPGWVRCYPYEQEASAGSEIVIEVRLTNHGPQASEAKVEPVLPIGWIWDEAASKATLSVPARTDGTAAPFAENPDGVARISITIPEGAAPGLTVIPFRVTFDKRYLGQIRHALVMVAAEDFL